MVQKNSFASRRDYWQKHILAHQASGQSSKDYCQQHNLKLEHFCYAKYQVLKSPPSGKFGIANDRSKPNQQSMLIPVRLGAHSAATDKIAADTCVLMAFPASVDPAWLGAVIEGLRR